MKSATVLFLALMTLTAVVIGDQSNSDSSESKSNDVEHGPPDTTDEIVCPIDWGLKCVRPLSEIAPKTGTAKQFCKGIQGGYVAENRCHIPLGTLIDANECCRFG